MAGSSGTSSVVPSMAHTSSPRHHDPAVRGAAALPRSRSNKARSGAGPSLVRACHHAAAVTFAAAPSRALVSLRQTAGYPAGSNNAAASSR